MFIRDRDFPNSFRDPFRKTSEFDRSYNCIAWAAENSTMWIEPDPSYNYFWPDQVPREYTIEALVQLYEHYGFVRCADGQNEDGFFKVAIFAKHGSPEHAARQIQPGMWSSKLGEGIDVSHSISSMEGGCYGDVVQYLKKPIAN